MQYSYADPLLKGLVTQTNEDMAIADILAFNPDFSDDDLEGIIPYRAYILCCIDNMKDSQDMFSAKKKAYEKELYAAVNLARTKNKVGVTQSVFSIAIGRA